MRCNKAPSMEATRFMKRPSRAWLISCALLFFALASVSAQGVHTLQGKVIAPNGSAPTQPIKVTLTYSARPTYETFTDLGGHFSLTGLSKGTYELTAEGDDATFETTSATPDVAAVVSAPAI